ncbi:MAG TPA: response regulator transcription factor [Candidatus Micrarchaeia archaeon]|nr:response regulator transcription factor [Candidatus Micrarchaeia archaeon]
MIRLVIADDQPLVLSGLRMVFDPEPDLEVVGAAADGAEAIILCRRLRPDVAVLDLRMPRLDGIQATAALLGAGGPAGLRVLVLTTFDDDSSVYGALRAGASGFLLKDAPPEQIAAAVRTVAGGEALLAPRITRRLIAAFAAGPRRDGEDRRLEACTERELEVLRLIARGLSNSEIAETLRLGESTVKTHVGHLLGKLELRDRVQAVVFAFESGLVGAGSG